MSDAPAKPPAIEGDVIAQSDGYELQELHVEMLADGRKRWSPAPDPRTAGIGARNITPEKRK